MQIWGIVVAAGSGKRFGGPKQFARLGATRVVDHAVASLSKCVDEIVVVVPDGFAWDGAPVAAAVPGGDTRCASVRSALEVVPADVEVVFVHDAVRPYVSQRVCEDLLERIQQGADGAIPVLSVNDTVKRVRGSEVVSTENRAELKLAQTPQAFRAATLRAAYALGRDASDDATLVEELGGKVAVVEGDLRSIKITSEDDVSLVEWLVSQ